MHRIRALDTLRGIAILWVMVCHATLIYPTEPIGVLARQIARLGWVGVDLFFVLSGFLITRILIERRGRPDYWRHFYERRVRRIVPAYLATVLFLLLVAPHLGAAWRGVADAAHANRGLLLTFLFTNVPDFVRTAPTGISATGHFWSLAVEEQFYLVWPFVVAVCAPARLRTVCLLLIPFACLVRVTLHFADVHGLIVYSLTLARVDELGAGALVAVLSGDAIGRAVLLRWAPRIIPAAALAFVAVFLTTFSEPGSLPMIAVGTPALALGCASVIALVVLAPDGRWSRWLGALAPLRWLGVVSYGAYLLHGIPLMVLVNSGRGPVDAQSQFMFYGLVIGLTVIAASASWWLIERPILRGRHRHQASRNTVQRHDRPLREVPRVGEYRDLIDS